MTREADTASNISETEYVAGLIDRAHQAQRIAESYSQEKVDELVTAIAWAACKEENASKIARLAFEESRMGNYEDKYAKLIKKVKGVLRDIKDEKSVGVIERNVDKGIVKIAKPVGVIGALVPCTNPEATPVVKAMSAIKARNAVVFSPHPRTKRTNKLVVDILRDVLKRHNAPEDLLINIDNPTLEISNQVMKQCDLVLATGGSAMVKAAYSSGTPAYGVGTGNAVVIVDETADIKDAAHKIMLGKTFDYATSCSSENSLVIQKSIYDALIDALRQEGGYLVNSEEKDKLQRTMWIEGHLNGDIVAQPAQRIAELAGIKLEKGVKFIMVPETGIGKEYPFSGEKMSVVMTIYKYDKFEEAIDRINGITGFLGKGHSCGIHSDNEDHITKLSLETKISRIMVRQPQSAGNSGDWTNGMPFTMTLGCGTWGGNISTENITWKHLINVTWMSFPIAANKPTDEELFGEIMKE